MYSSSNVSRYTEEAGREFPVPNAQACDKLGATGSNPREL